MEVYTPLYEECIDSYLAFSPLTPTSYGGGGGDELVDADFFSLLGDDPVGGLNMEALGLHDTNVKDKMEVVGDKLTKLIVFETMEGGISKKEKEEMVSGDENKEGMVDGDENKEGMVVVVDGDENKEEVVVEGDENTEVVDGDENTEVVDGDENKEEVVVDGDENKEEVVVDGDENKEEVVDGDEMVDGDENTEVVDGDENTEVVDGDENTEVVDGDENTEDMVDGDGNTEVVSMDGDEKMEEMTPMEEDENTEEEEVPVEEARKKKKKTHATRAGKKQCISPVDESDWRGVDMVDNIMYNRPVNGFIGVSMDNSGQLRVRVKWMCSWIHFSIVSDKPAICALLHELKDDPRGSYQNKVLIGNTMSYYHLCKKKKYKPAPEYVGMRQVDSYNNIAMRGGVLKVNVSWKDTWEPIERVAECQDGLHYLNNMSKTKESWEGQERLSAMLKNY